jgi:hypothetical protein
MRTSYNRNNEERETVNKEVSSTQGVKENESTISAEKENLIKAYNEIAEEVSLRQEEQLRSYDSMLEREADSLEKREELLEARKIQKKIDSENELELESSMEEEDKKRKKKKKKKIVVGVFVSFLLLIGVFSVLFGRKGSYNEEEISSSISKMYTSPDKVDIKENISQQDLSKYYSELVKAKKNGKDVDKYVEELDSIGYFLSDKSKLVEMNSSSYDLTSQGMLDEVNKIVENSKNYSVSGLAVTINDLASRLNSSYNEFVDLRQELQSVSDVSTFDENLYKERIDKVSHEYNKNELLTIYDKIIADKQTVLKQKELNDAKSEEERKKAEDELKKSQELQKKTEEELNKIKDKLEEKSNELKDSLIKGNKDKEDKVEENNTDSENLEDDIKQE